MRKILVVIDMQNDFTYGALRNEDAIAVIPKISKKISSFDGEIIFTRDTHTEEYMSTQEGRRLPVIHCVKGTEGWELVPELDAFAKSHNCKVYDKPAFGSVQLALDLKAMNDEQAIDEIEFVGVCTDICVISNVMLTKAALPEVTVSVDAGCCAGVTKESHETALAAMKGCQTDVLYND